MRPNAAPAAEAETVWSVEGRFRHLIFSPKGAIEGLLIDTDGIPTQYVLDPHGSIPDDLLAQLRRDRLLQVEGIEAAPSPKGEAPHTVYRFVRIATIDGEPAPAGAASADGLSQGRVLHFNHARHGEPNGVVLDNGDFIHTKPDGLRRLGLSPGDAVTARGESRPLAFGRGRVIEAHIVNGRAVRPGES